MERNKKFKITSYIIAIMSIINGLLLSIVLINNWDHADLIRIIENNKSEIIYLSNDSFKVISCIFIFFLIINGIINLFKHDFVMIRIYMIGYILLFLSFIINEFVKINTYSYAFSQSAKALALYVLISSLISLIFEIILMFKIIKDTNGLIIHLVITGIVLSNSMLLVINYFDFIGKIETLSFIFNGSFYDILLMSSLILLLIFIPVHLILIFVGDSFNFIETKE